VKAYVSRRTGRPSLRPGRAIIDDVSATKAELIATGRDALRRGDGAAARVAFSAARELGEDGSVLEGLAKAAYLELDYSQAIALWERTYATYRDEGDGVAAARTARMLAYMYGTVVGDGAVMQGWHARAQDLLSKADETSEAGWVSLSAGMFEPDREKKDRLYRAAVEIAQRSGDTDLQFCVMAYLGASLVHGDRIEEGMLLLDEACAAVVGRDVDDFCVLEEIFCQLFSACEHAHDVERADQWIRVAEDIAQRRNLPTISAFCRTHYGGVLTTAGRWVEAEAALTEAVRLWTLGHGMLRSGALIRLGDLRVMQGRIEEAERLLEGYEHWPEAARALAGIHLGRGEHGRAAEVLERALEQVDASSAGAGPIWSALVDVHLGAGDVEKADAAAERLHEAASRHPGHYLRSAAALARGRVCLASGTGDPRTCLREALSGFAQARMPMELARARLELAGALVDESPDVAVAEAKAAFEAFEKLNAARHVDAAAALLRTLGGPARTGRKGTGGSGALTKREQEVLELLGLGLSNPEISDRLFISRKTVEHHVGNVLAKLGLRGRAEAAAHAARNAPRP
jgi:DNA-binding CsgD family transcriptional regulator